MTLRMRGSWVLSGIIAMSALAVPMADAQAGAILAKKGMTAQVGDPMFDYVFEIDLQANSTLFTGGFITVYDVPFLAGPPLSSQPPIWGASVQNTGITPLNTPEHDIDMDNPTIPNITWIYHGPTLVNSTNSDMDLGDFRIGRTGELDSPPSATLLFVGSLDGTNFSNDGFVTVNVIPEPSSMALLLVGVSTLPLVWIRNKRRAACVKIIQRLA